MRELSQSQIEDIKADYPYRWQEEMFKPSKIEKGLAFIERHKKYNFSYQEVFFSPNGFAIYELYGKKRIFCLPTGSLFSLTPLNEKYAEGNWQSWLRQATLIEELK